MLFMYRPQWLPPSTRSIYLVLSASSCGCVRCTAWQAVSASASVLETRLLGLLGKESMLMLMTVLLVCRSVGRSVARRRGVASGAARVFVEQQCGSAAQAVKTREQGLRLRSPGPCLAPEGRHLTLGCRDGQACGWRHWWWLGRPGRVAASLCRLRRWPCLESLNVRTRLPACLVCRFVCLLAACTPARLPRPPASSPSRPLVARPLACDWLGLAG